MVQGCRLGRNQQTVTNVLWRVDVLDLDDYPRPSWEVSGAVLTMAPHQAGNHVAERLDCPEHGPQLMWTPFGGDEQTPGQGTAT